MNFRRLIKKYFKSTEEVVSMFLGLVIVVVVVGLIFNFFQKRKGNINIPGSNDVKISQDSKKDNVNADEYIVKKGDSLWSIAMKEYNDGYQWVNLAKTNDLKNPSNIEVGQKLILPNIVKKDVLIASNKDNISVPSGDYKVVKGDSLWKIAVRAYGDGYRWTKIWQDNKSKIINPNGLEIGMVLMISGLK